MKSNSTLRKLSAEVKSTRTDISLILATLTASKTPQIRILLNELSAQKAELAESFRQLEESAARQLDSLSNSLGSIQESIMRNGEAVEALRQINNTHRSPISLQTSILRPNRCRPLCSCCCHERKTRNLPKWLQLAVGSLLIGYCGIPNSRPCNVQSCRKEDEGLLSKCCFKTVLIS